MRPPRKRKWVVVWPVWFTPRPPSALTGNSHRTRREAIAHAEQLCGFKWATLYRRGMHCGWYLGGPVETWEVFGPCPSSAYPPV